MAPIIHRGLLAVLACLPVALPAPPQQGAHSLGTPVAPATQEAGAGLPTTTLEQLVQELEDPVQREHLVRQLKVLLAARQAAAGSADAEASPGLVSGLTALLGHVSQRVRVGLNDLLVQLSRLPARWREFVDQLQDPGALQNLLLQAGAALGVGLAAAAAGLVAWWLLRRVQRRLEARSQAGPYPFAGRLWRQLLSAVLAAAPVLVTAGAAFVAIALLAPAPAVRRIVVALVFAIVARRLLDVAVRLLLAPKAPGLRLVRLEDEHASALSAALTRLGAYAIGGDLVLEILAGVGAADALLSPLRGVYCLVLLGGGIALVLAERRRARPHLQTASPGGHHRDAASTSFRSALMSALGLWWIAAIAYMVGLYAVWASGVAGGLAFLVRATIRTMLVGAAAALLAWALRRVLARAAEHGHRLSKRYPELNARVPRYLQGALMVAQVGIGVVATCLCLEAWGVSALEVLASPWAQGVFRALFGILLVMLTAAATIDVATVFTQRYLESQERRGTVTGKVRTLVPLVRSGIRLVVVVAAVLMILDQIGVQIAPLLAGVGVLGLAIGFGAQTLVKDVITGVFILVEDTLSVGDVITINGTGGLVEGIHIRTVRLRDQSGNVHTIPYSAVATITNMTKGFSRWVVEARVAYREDVDEVTAILKEIGDGLQREPEFGKDILVPIEILGLDRFEDSAVVVQARLTTRPLEQWRIGREFNRRMKLAFEEHGIEIPFPHRTLYFGEDKQGAAPPLRVQGRADGDGKAAGAIEPITGP